MLTGKSAAIRRRSSPPSRGGAALFAALVFAGAMPAQWATAQPIAPLVPEIEPAPDPAIVARFHEALATGLQNARRPTLGFEQVAKATQAGGPACAAAPCALAAQRALRVERAATARIGVVGRNYTIAVGLYRGMVLEGRASGRCDVCTLAEATTALSEVAQRAARSTEAAAAGNLAPGVPVDQSPTRAIAAAGSAGAVQPPAATRSAPRPAKRSARRSRARARHAQQNGADPARPASPAARWPLWPALAATGVAAVGLAIGLPLIAIDGQGTDCRGPARPDYRNCERLYATAGGGWVMTTVALASLASAGALFYLYLTPRRQVAPRHDGSARQPLALSVLRHLHVAPAAGGLWIGGGGAF